MTITTKKRKLTIITITAVALLVLSGYAIAVNGAGSVANPSADKGKAGLARVMLDVQNMSCGGCEATIRDSLMKIDGVKEVQVDLAGKTAAVLYAPQKIADANRLAEVVTQSGYPATVLKVDAADQLSPQRRANFGACGGGCCSLRR